jgi:hypothetical protein
MGGRADGRGGGGSSGDGNGRADEGNGKDFEWVDLGENCVTSVT